MSNSLKEKFFNKSAKVAVVGLGYVGLPLAVSTAKAGYETHGIDVSHDRIKKIQSGESYILDIDSMELKSLLGRRLFVDNDFSSLTVADAIIICIPTPLDKNKVPDLSYIKDSVEQIANYMKEQALIILESTSYPGSTQELITSVIENKRKLKVGRDFYVCFSPERVDPGNKNFNIQNTPKVIGGETANCLAMGVALYKHISKDVVPVSATKVAEMVKLLENTYRSINIAFVNELTQLCERMGINIWEVINAAATKPYGFMPFYPGPGVGGHCIPLDPMYLSWKAKLYGHYNRFIELASDINENMPRYVVGEIADILNNEGRPINRSVILLLGVAYKKDIDDFRESPALTIHSILEEKGAKVQYYDPYIERFNLNGKMVKSVTLTSEVISNADIVVILADHNTENYETVVKHAKIVYDTRNATEGIVTDNVILLGNCRYAKEIMNYETKL
ncbi:nucleotide sugar dehydrogenase [Phosphitispora fastidiosa]|uniref:nucleotide sugar dehydrogenase n=1 Tax=Phosphitispora fastidiosa TaxID=2837202 RepID=UPI001E3A4E94|nr:nucleotide sugar dehydrogenase [Phosphitispora fastidiosa]MBU7008553.1 UDP-N-acetyl-D-glucosamine dehydrogenase [Phosphitispora fastidiosa]